MIVVALVASVAASIGLVVTYASGGDPQWEGALLGVSLGGIGWALVATAHRLLDQEATEERSPLASSTEDHRAVGDDLAAPTSRRGLLVGLLATALGALAVALGLPVRSLGGGPGRQLYETPWRRGVRLVDEAGVPIDVGTLPIGGAITVFPESVEQVGDSIVILVRVEPESLELPPEREGWAPEGYLAYSKVCTHAGCPVGLFDNDSGLLICPCHQSSFVVRRGASPRFGPAARPLPQLPIEVDGEGHLVATDEMSDPVGPGFWGLPRDPA